MSSAKRVLEPGKCPSILEEQGERQGGSKISAVISTIASDAQLSVASSHAAGLTGTVDLVKLVPCVPISNLERDSQVTAAR